MPRKIFRKKFDLAEQIKKHPVVTALLLVFAAMAGIGPVLQDLRSLPNAVTCIPYELGLWPYKGRATIVTTTFEYGWNKVDMISETKGTKNHHCEKHCRGEPTRTNYQIVITLRQNTESPVRTLRNARLECISGPCGGWNEIIETTINSSGRKATGSFDVWSKPTTLRLLADVYERQVTGAKRFEKEQNVSTKNLFELVVPRSDSSVAVQGTMSEGTKFSFEVDQQDASGIFQPLKNSQSHERPEIHHVFRILNPNCQT